MTDTDTSTTGYVGDAERALRFGLLADATFPLWPARKRTITRWHTARNQSLRASDLAEDVGTVP